MMPFARLNALIDENVNRGEILRGFDVQIHPQETEEIRRILEDVEEQEDVDHQV